LEKWGSIDVLEKRHEVHRVAVDVLVVILHRTRSVDLRRALPRYLRHFSPPLVVPTILPRSAAWRCSRGSRLAAATIWAAESQVKPRRPPPPDEHLRASANAQFASSDLVSAGWKDGPGVGGGSPKSSSLHRNG